MTKQELTFRLMTYNVGGGRKDAGSAVNAIAKVIERVSPDVLALQETIELQDAEGNWQSVHNQIAKSTGFGKHVCFRPTLSMRQHLHVGKRLFIHGIFNDWRDWKQGNAILARQGFVRLGDPSKPGVPRNVPLFQAPLYQGNRDTDPRSALLARVNGAPIFPFVLGLHLTTLVGERGPEPLSGKTEDAEIRRFEQTRRLLDLLREHVLEPGKVVFLLGDFNAGPSEPCISQVLEKEGAFKRLTPSNDEISTHPKTEAPIDHIFVFPEDRLVEYRCWIVDNPTARQASDHLPVVAEITVI